MKDEKLKACPFCEEKAYFYKMEIDRIMHKEGCYFTDDTLFNIKEDNKAWNTRPPSLDGVKGIINILGSSNRLKCFDWEYSDKYRLAKALSPLLQPKVECGNHVVKGTDCICEKCGACLLCCSEEDKKECSNFQPKAEWDEDKAVKYICQQFNCEDVEIIPMIKALIQRFQPPQRIWLEEILKETSRMMEDSTYPDSDNILESITTHFKNGACAIVGPDMINDIRKEIELCKAAHPVKEEKHEK